MSAVEDYFSDQERLFIICRFSAYIKFSERDYSKYSVDYVKSLNIENNISSLLDKKIKSKLKKEYFVSDLALEAMAKRFSEISRQNVSAYRMIRGLLTEEENYLFSTDLNVFSGSIKIEDGFIKIKSGKLIALSIIMGFSYNVLVDYTDIKKTIIAIQKDIPFVLKAVFDELEFESIKVKENMLGNTQITAGMLGKVPKDEYELVVYLLKTYSEERKLIKEQKNGIVN